MEKSTYSTTNGFVHTATNRRWTRHHKTDSTKKNPHQTYGWNKRTCSGNMTGQQKRQATFGKEWTGSTNLDCPQFKDEFITEDIDEQQEARKAKGIPAPRQPTEQERMEHELTHLPYRSWCPLCVQGKGRADNHPKQHSKTPVISSRHHLLQVHQRNKDNTSTDSS